MVGETKSESGAAPDKSSAAEAQKRERSSIAFPYQDLNAAILVANAIHDNVGLGSCSLDQIAAWLKVSAKSSGLRLQMTTARLFGLIEGEGMYHLTPLGRRLVDPNQARKAKAEAFLTIPLYRAVFDKYRGGVLPPPAALERDMASLGVAEKQKDRARQVFERSAEQANFFEHGRDRLVEPAIKGGEAIHSNLEEEKKPNGGDGGGGGGQLDPLIAALIQKLPPAKTSWPSHERVTWLQMMTMAFDLSYGSGGAITITGPKEAPASESASDKELLK